MAGNRKKLIQINTVCNTSTGKIMGDIQREAVLRGYDTLSFVGRRKPFTDVPCVKFGNPISFWSHVALNTVFDKQGYGSYFAAKKLIQQIRKKQPDIIHLHNLHGYYLHVPMLFQYLKNEFKGNVFWTFHDCWPFTGHCPYFTMAGCEKWKTQCSHCPNKTKYPISFFLDASKQNYEEKKKMFGGIKNLTILTPSNWMKDLVEDSFLKEKQVYVTPNGIDIHTFSYKRDKEVLKKYQIPVNKKILLGVANIWDERKGLNDFIRLSGHLSDDYQIVLAGLNKNQIKKLPKKILGIMKTENQKELAAIYSGAEIFINPSREESFSLVTVEAFACGTPVIVLNTSAVKELVCDRNGIVLSSTDVKSYLEAIRKIEIGNYNRKDVASCAEKYDYHKTASDILDLYEKVMQRESTR